MRGVSSVLLILGVVAAACADDGDPATTTPNPVISTAEAPTAPLSPATSASVPVPAGWVVYRRAGDLWVGRLDGSTARAVTSGSLGAGYGGYAHIDGEPWLYYTSQITESFTPGEGESGIFQVARQPLQGGDVQELFRFRGANKHVEYGTRNASVTSDGTRVAYADERGLNVFDVRTGEDRPLVSNVSCDEARAPGDCYGYFRPDWSPDGSSILAAKIFFEGGVGVVLRTDASPASETALGHGGLFQSWSPDGELICVSESGYSPAGAGLVVVDSVTYSEVASRLNLGDPAKDHVIAEDCALSDDGRIAVQYSLTSGRERFVAYWRLGEDNIVHAMLPLRDVRTLTWLPYGSGIVFSTGMWGRLGGPVVLSLDETTYSLPIDDVDLVLGVIP